MAAQTVAADKKLPANVTEAIGRRILERPDPYDPWMVLNFCDGLELRWHGQGPHEGHHNPWGLCDFRNASISLQLGLLPHESRGTLTHELIHMERGPKPESVLEADEEREVNWLAVQRLVDPHIYELVMDATEGAPSDQVVRRIVNVAPHMFSIYVDWRRNVSAEHAEEIWTSAAAAQTRPVWPPVWLERFDASPAWKQLRA